MHSEISELCALFLVLLSDLEFCKENQRSSKSDFWDRARVRVFFSLVEGVTYRVRQLLIARHDQGEISLSREERHVLEEVRYDVDQKGSIREVDSFMRFVGAFRLSMGLFARQHGKGEYFSSAIGHNGWQAFSEAVEIRDRLTHPKSVREVRVTANENRQIELAEKWYMSVMQSILGTSLEELKPVQNQAVTGDAADGGGSQG
jgi:hypothetical protein